MLSVATSLLRSGWCDEADGGVLDPFDSGVGVREIVLKSRLWDRDRSCGWEALPEMEAMVGRFVVEFDFIARLTLEVGLTVIGGVEDREGILEEEVERETRGSM